MAIKRVCLSEYPSVTEFIDREMIAFNNQLECRFQPVFLQGRAGEIAEYAKQAIIRAGKETKIFEEE